MVALQHKGVYKSAAVGGPPTLTGKPHCLATNHHSEGSRKHPPRPAPAHVIVKRNLKHATASLMIFETPTALITHTTPSHVVRVTVRCWPTEQIVTSGSR